MNAHNTPALTILAMLLTLTGLVAAIEGFRHINLWSRIPTSMPYQHTRLQHALAEVTFGIAAGATGLLM